MKGRKISENLDICMIEDSDYKLNLCRQEDGQTGEWEKMSMFMVIVTSPQFLPVTYVMAPSADDAIGQTLCGFDSISETDEGFRAEAHRLPFRMRGWGTQTF